MTALLGKYDLDVDNESGSKSFSVFNFSCHPRWNSSAIKYDFDISVVTLTGSVTFSNQIRPVCLPLPSENEIKGNGTIVGWGGTVEEAQSDDQQGSPLKMLVVQTYPLNVCKKEMTHIKRLVSDHNFCAGFFNESKAPVQGDSGGGFYELNISSYTWTVNGIISWSDINRSQVDIDLPSFYVNVAMLTLWVEEEMKKNKLEMENVDFDCSLNSKL